MTTLTNLYHLNKPRFWLDPDEDASFYFGGTKMDKRLIERLRTAFIESGIPKFMIHGQYGSGKTHTLAHIQYALANDKRFGANPTKVQRFELPPLGARERWSLAHKHFVNAIGMGLARDAIAGVMSKAPPGSDPLEVFNTPGVIRFGESALLTSQAHIYRNLLFGGRPATLSWEWLKGQHLAASDAATLGIETQLEEPSQLIDALLNIANMIYRGLDRKLVFLVDEAEALKGITSPDSHQEFVFGFRRLFGTENDILGMVMAFQLEGGMEDAPPILWDEAVRRRVNYDAGYIDLRTLISEMDDVRKFMLEALVYLVDQKAAKESIKKHSLDTEPEFFPFTSDAVDAIAQWVNEEPERMLPSQIVAKMSDAVSKAMLMAEDDGLTKPRLVDGDIVDRTLYPPEAGQ